MRNPLEGCASMSTSGEIFAQHPSVLNRYFKGSAAREAEKATVELPPVGGPPLSIFVLLLCCCFLFTRDNCRFLCQEHFFEKNVFFETNTTIQKRGESEEKIQKSTNKHHTLNLHVSL